MIVKLAACGLGAALFALSGCASVPPESAQLSANIGRQVHEIGKSHLFYVNRYYERLEAQANDAVDQLYAPAIVGSALRGEAGKELFSRLRAGREGDAAAPDAIAFAARFLTLVRNKVEEKRKSDTEPIRKAKRAALAATEAAYSQLSRGNATITSYLGSLVRLRDAQDKLFAGIGLPDLQDHAAKSLADASDEMAGLLQMTEPSKFDALKAAPEKPADGK